MTRRFAGRVRGVAVGLTLAIPLGACAGGGQASSHAPAGSAHVVLSLQGIECQSCGASAVNALQELSGVHEATFDRETAEITVTYDADVVEPITFVAAVRELGYGVSEGPGHGAYTPEVEFPAELDVVQISENGEAADIEEHRVPGKVTVFDFHAVWCGPCKKVDRHMLSVLREHEDVALRKLDVVDWDSEIAKTYLRDVPNLPYLVVYGTDGKEVAEISGLELEALDTAISEGRQR